MAKTNKPGLALIAHDAKKPDIIAFSKEFKNELHQFNLYSTGTTGSLIVDESPDLLIHRVKSGPDGGDQQIGALIAEREIHGLIFLIDPKSPMPHDVDIKALIRLGVLYNIPMALNLDSAKLVIDPKIYSEKK